MPPGLKTRRTFLGACALAVIGPVRAKAQPAARLWRIGRLSPSSAETETPFLNAFRAGLKELGWAEGQNFTIEARFADGRPERLPALASELVQQRVDLMLTGSNPGAVAAMKASTTIPIVMVTTGDPVRGGIVASLARPGGNVTGVTALGQVLSAKRLEVLKDAVPGIARIAVLVNPSSSYTAPFLAERERIARELGLELGVFEAKDAGRLQPAFAAIANERPGALMVLNDLMFLTERRVIVELAARHRLFAVYFERAFIDAGGLMFYGASLVDMYRRAAGFVDRILKGARPADLPIEQPRKFDFVVNLKTAEALGVTIPQSLLLRADHVIR